MLEVNKLFLDAYVMVNKFFQTNHINYYPASVGPKYKELFKRDAFACLSFYDSNNEQYYMYFNSAYNRDINRMIFSSIAVVSRDNLNMNKASLECKIHVENVEDVKTFLESLKGVI